MASVIFSFSATGNSLALARKLASELGDTEMFSIRKGAGFTGDLSH